MGGMVMKFLKKLNFAIIFIFAMVLVPVKVYGIEGDYNEMSLSVGQPCEKEWNIQFSKPVNISTINSENIKIYEASDTGFKKPLSVYVGASDNDTAIIGAPVSGFVPDESYYIVIGTGIEGTSGEHLSKSVIKKFTVKDSFECSSGYADLPGISEIKYGKIPFISTEKPVFSVTSDGEKVQYRIFVHKYMDGYEGYEEVTQGKYTEPAYGNVPCSITSDKNLESKYGGQKYKLIVFVKRADEKGTHNTYIDGQQIDFDNYYVDYFRCVSDTNSADANKVNVSYSVNSMIDMENECSPKTNEGQSNGGWVNPSISQLKYYINPQNFMDSYGIDMFLRLDSYSPISADSINSMLKGKGLLEGKGQAFLDAAKKYNINPAYIVAHSLIETAGGTSKLSKGVSYNGKTVYNFFGISAIDKDPVNAASKYACDKGWFSPEAAITGGAEYLSSEYINNKTYKQNTLYKMRWNYDGEGKHQYATDIAWSYKILLYMQPLMANSNCVNQFDIPEYK